MRTRILVSSITLAAGVLILVPNVFAKTASCPCSPCKCSPCTCGAGGPSKGGKHHEKERGHEHGGGVGVGVNVDLGGVGQRKAEPNPFGASNEPSTSTTTREKTTTKHPGQPTTTTFDKVELTGDKAKDLEESNQSGGALPVSDQTGEKTESPAPQTEEKKTGGKLDNTQKLLEEKAKWEEMNAKKKDWKKKQKLFYKALANKVLAQAKYNSALQQYFDKNEKYKEAKAKRDKEKAKGNILQNPDSAEAEAKLTSIEVELEKEFQKTPDGKTLQEELNKAQQALDKAETAEKEAKEAAEKAGVPPEIKPLKKGQSKP